MIAWCHYHAGLAALPLSKSLLAFAEANLFTYEKCISMDIWYCAQNGKSRLHSEERLSPDGSTSPSLVIGLSTATLASSRRESPWCEANIWWDWFTRSGTRAPPGKPAAASLLKRVSVKHAQFVCKWSNHSWSISVLGR